MFIFLCRKIIKTDLINLNIRFIISVLVMYSAYAASASAQQFLYDTQVSTTAVNQNTLDKDNNAKIDSQNIVITPSISLSYRSRHLNGFWSATHNHVRRQLEEAEISEDFTNYRYGGSVGLLNNVVTVRASGALTNIAPDFNGFLVDDFLLNSGNLAKVRNNAVLATLTLPEGDYIGFSGNISYANIESENNRNRLGNTNQSGRFNNDIYSASYRAQTGRAFSRLYAEVSSQFTLSERDAESADFFNRRVIGQISHKLISDLGVIVTASNEGNQISGQNTFFSNTRNFTSYGAGLSWRESENRFISLTINEFDLDNGNLSAEESDDETQFVGVNINWQFSPRTELSADYGRRFFGESGALSFSHRIKRFRTVLSYNEDITSFSNLIAAPDDLGVFVCANGQRNLSNCFQPNSLTYALAPNEEFVQFSQQNTQISDEIILRKSLSWQLGASFRRTNISINGIYSENDFLESPQFNRTYSAGVVLGFEIGRRTSLNYNVNYAVSNNILENANNETQTVSSSFNLTHELSRTMNLDLGFRYLNRENIGDLIDAGGAGGFGGINGDLIDRRVTLSFTYQRSNQ